MSDQRSLNALARIESALQRIEASLSDTPTLPHHEDELQQLREVHQALRGKVETAIVQIDRLLATEGVR